MGLWFTADCHFEHDNIIHYCKRPFKDVHEMNEELVKRWNKKVKPEDTVIVLGDFSFKGILGDSKGDLPLSLAQYWRGRLNGDIVFVQGNHDNTNLTVKTDILSIVMKLGKHMVYCVHRPEDYNKDYPINLVGHVHNHWKVRKIYDNYLVNVGVDVWDYTPVSFRQLMLRLRAFMEKEKKVRFEGGDISEEGTVVP